MTELNESPKFLAVDFYCGAGGTTRGLIDAGGYTIAGVDKDAACRATYQENNTNKTLDRKEPEFINKDMFPASIEYPDGQQEEIKEKLAKLIEEYRIKAEGIPLLFTVCAPCQSFTKFVQRSLTPERTAGRERDTNLLAQATAFIEEFEPEMVMSENVADISGGKYGHIWKGFQEWLRDKGYRVGSGQVNASDFGIAQRRKRSIIIALKAGTDSRPAPDLELPNRDENAQEKTVREVIKDLPRISAGGESDAPPNHKCRNLTDLNRQRLVAVGPGEPNFGFPDELTLACHQRLESKGTRGFGDTYTRIHPDRPGPTITTRFHSVSNGRFGHYDEEQARGLSLREGAMLQSFPEEYEFHGDSMDAIARMIGNAVPPKLAQYMATALYDLWGQERSGTGETD